MGVAASTASYHLGVLREAGLVQITRHGRNHLVEWTGVKMGVVTDAEVQAAWEQP